MKIRLECITLELLSEIIENIGSLSITKCEPHVDGDDVLFDIEFVGIGILIGYCAACCSDWWVEDDQIKH